MTKTTVVALIATLGLSVPASAYQSFAMSKNASTTVSGVFAPSVNAIMKGVNSLLDSTAREVSQDAIALSYNASTTVYNSTAKVVRGTWTMSTNTSAAVTAPIWEVSTDTADKASKSTIYKKVVGASTSVYNKSADVSTDALTSEDGVKSVNVSKNVSAAYSAASMQASTFAWNSTKTGLSMAANSVNKAVVVTVNGSKAVATWSTNDVSKADNKSAAPAALSTFVSAKFVNALDSSVKASQDLILDGGWKNSGLTVSIVKASKASVAGSKAVAGSLWVVVTAGSTDSYDKFSNGEYSQASEVLLMLPLQSVKGASAVSTSTKKDDELGEGDIPDTKKGK